MCQPIHRPPPSPTYPSTCPFSYFHPCVQLCNYPSKLHRRGGVKRCGKLGSQALPRAFCQTGCRCQSSGYRHNGLCSKSGNFAIVHHMVKRPPRPPETPHIHCTTMLTSVYISTSTMVKQKISCDIIVYGVIVHRIHRMHSVNNKLMTEVH